MTDSSPLTAASTAGVQAALRRAQDELDTCTEAIRAEVANLDRTAIKAAFDRVRQTVGAAIPVSPENRKQVIGIMDGKVFPVGVTESYSVDPETGDVSFTCVRPDGEADVFVVETGDRS